MVAEQVDLEREQDWLLRQAPFTQLLLAQAAVPLHIKIKETTVAIPYLQRLLAQAAVAVETMEILREAQETAAVLVAAVDFVKQQGQVVEDLVIHLLHHQAKAIMEELDL